MLKTEATAVPEVLPRAIVMAIARDESMIVIACRGVNDA
jgi:hypothetical protein